MVKLKNRTSSKKPAAFVPGSVLVLLAVIAGIPLIALVAFHNTQSSAAYEVLLSLERAAAADVGDYGEDGEGVTGGGSLGTLKDQSGSRLVGGEVVGGSVGSPPGTQPDPKVVGDKVSTHGKGSNKNGNDAVLVLSPPPGLSGMLAGRTSSSPPVGLPYLRNQSLKLPAWPWHPPITEMPTDEGVQAAATEEQIAKAMQTFRDGPPPENKTPPGSDKWHPADPWTANVEKALTGPVNERLSSDAYHGPRKLLLVCLFTGGDPGQKTAADQEDRVNAVESSWADTDVYWVTRREDVNMTRRIRLPDEAETGGYKKIWKKSLHLFHYVTHSELGKQYDFVFKGDDDTFVNLAEMRELLAAFDPNIPAQFGNNLYGVGARGAVPAPPFYWQNRGIDSCHGGAGYVISRGALDITADHWLGCATEWPGSGYEDATVAFCLMRHVGTACFGMKMDFGWDRYHNSKRENVGMKLDLLEQTPAKYAAATTFHPVPPVFQSRIYDSIQKFRGSHGTEARKMREASLAKSRKQFVAQWNCTIDTVSPPVNGICQQYALKKPPLAFKPRVAGRKTKQVPAQWVHQSEHTVSGQPDAQDAVFVIFDQKLTPEHPMVQAERALLLLILSFRAVNAGARIIVFARNAVAEMVVKVLERSGDSLVEMVQMVGEAVASKSEYNALPGHAGVATLISSFLLVRGREFNRIVLMSGSAALFQRDPFASVPIHANGVTVFVTDTYPAKLTDFNADVALNFEWMGVCNEHDRRTLESAANRAHAKEEPRAGKEYFRGSGLIDAGVVVGSSLGLQIVLAEFALEFMQVPSLFWRVCSPTQHFSRMVWKKEFSERVPLMIPAVSQSAVVALTAGDSSTWQIVRGVVLNKDGLSATVVLTSDSCVCCSVNEIREGGYTQLESICPSAALQHMSLLSEVNLL
jgi:hypothetical protein